MAVLSSKVLVLRVKFCGISFTFGLSHFASPLPRKVALRELEEVDHTAYHRSNIPTVERLVKEAVEISLR